MRPPLALLQLAPVLVVACGATPAPAPPHELPPVTTRPEVAVVSTAPHEVDAGATAPPLPASSDALVIVPAPPHTFAGAAGNIPGDSGLSGLFAVGDSVFASGSGFLLRSTDRGLHYARTEIEPRFPVVWAPLRSARSSWRAKAAWCDPPTAAPPSRPPVARAGPSVSGIRPQRRGALRRGLGRGGPFVGRSVDHGATWTRLPVPITDGWLHDVGTTDGRDVLVAGTEEGTRATSRDPREQRRHPSLHRRRTSAHSGNGSPCSPKGGTDHEETRRICFAEGTLFASSAYGLHMTRDLGKTWRVATQVGAEVLALACRGKEVVVGGRNRSLFVSADGGATWSRDPLGTLFGEPSLVSVQAAAISEAGEMYVGFEGLYTDHRGSLFRRSP